MTEKTIKVTFYQRKPRNRGNYSVETYFNAVRAALPRGIISRVAVSRYESLGFFKRLYNCIEAISRQGHINHITGDVHFLNLFLQRRKNLLTVLDCGQLKSMKGIRYKLFRFIWFRLPANRSKYITTISNATKLDLLHHIKFDPEKIKVVPVCISSAFSRYDKEFNAKKPRILQLGAAPNKNIERLILSLENISCTLIIIGSVAKAHKTLAIERGVELITFETALQEDEVIEEYRKADIITLISTLEGFGMPIVEGNAIGRVVITGNITSMPEVANDAAHLADPFSVESMRDGFLRIINDTEYRNRLIESGFENCKRFSAEHIALQFAEIYKTIAVKTGCVLLFCSLCLF